MEQFNQDFNTNLPVPRKIDFDGKQRYVLSSIDLFERLGIKRYDSWCRDQIVDMGQEGLDYIFAVNNRKINSGRPKAEYLLSLDFAMPSGVTIKS